MKSNIKISVVVPIYNEEKIIAQLYERLINTVSKLTNEYEIIFVNDCSKDNSLTKLQDLAKINKKLKYLSFSKNFGHQIAITAGLYHSNGNAVIIIDGDLQDPPELITELYKKYKEGYKVVYAKRRIRKGETSFKRFTAKLFCRILSKITLTDIPIDTGDFRLIDRIIVEQLKKMPESNKFLRGQIAWMGFKQTFVEFDREKRRFGKTGYSLSKMLKFAMDGITSFSNFPLKLVLFAGILVSLIAFFIILYALHSKFILKEAISGWTSIIISTMFIGGIQLLSIGIIGEYISRINIDVKKRPLFIIEDSNIVTTDYTDVTD